MPLKTGGLKPSEKFEVGQRRHCHFAEVDLLRYIDETWKYWLLYTRLIVVDMNWDGADEGRSM